MPDAAWDAPRGRPADSAVALCGDHVLRGDPRARRHVEELLERLDSLDAGQRAVHAAIAQRHPRDGALASARIMVDDGPPDRFADFDRNARAALHFDRLANGRDEQHSGWRAIAIRVRRVGLENDEVTPIADGIGEGPCEVAVAAGDKRRHARKRHAGKASRPRVPPDHRCAIPDVRRRQAEVHVVGDDGAAVAGQATRHRPTVASTRIVVGGRRKPRQQRGALVRI